MVIAKLNRLLSPLKRRIRLMVGRGIVRLVNDTTKEQEVQISCLQGETLDQVERYQEYGFTSVPHSGAECITVSVGANRGHSVVIATGDRRYRFKEMKAGEVALYDDQGQIVHLKRTGISVATPFDIKLSAGGNVAVTANKTIELNAPVVKASNEVQAVTVTAGDGASTISNKIETTGDIKTTGNISATGTIKDGGGNTANHTH